MPSHIRRIFRGPLLLACLVGCLSFAAFTGSASADAELEATLVATPGTYYYGPNSPLPVQYTLTVTNSGDAASDATPYYFYTSLSLAGIGGGCTYHTRFLLSDYGTCNISALAPGSSQTKHFTADVTTPILSGNFRATIDTGGLLGTFIPDDVSLCHAQAQVTIQCPDPPDGGNLIDDILDGD